MRKIVPVACILLPLLTSGCIKIPGVGTPELELPAPGMELAKAAQPEISPAAPKAKIYCAVEKGTALFGKNWHDISQAKFDLIQGEKTLVNIHNTKSNAEMVLQARFDDNGQKMVFCPVREDLPPEARITCASIYALEDDFKMGIKRTLDVPQSLRSGILRCGYTPLKKG